MKNIKIPVIIGLLLILMIVFWSPFESESGGFSDILRDWSKQQSEISDEIVQNAVSGAEGNIVGEKEVDGSNWSIPNIIRNILGVD